MHTCVHMHTHNTVKPLNNGHVGAILLLYRGSPLKECFHGPEGTTELVLHREVKCAVSFI